MPLFHYLRLSVPHPYSNHVPDPLLWLPSSVMEYTHLPSRYQPNYYDSKVEKITSSFPFLNSLRPHPLRAFHIRLAVGQMPGSCNCHKSKVGIPPEMQTCNEEAELDVYNDCLDSLYDKDHKENERRRKIGLANKGKVPWNKYRKHTAETRLRIKQRTIEALRDPKVRRKMAEHPLAHSDESKARIGSALKHVWAKRLRRKRMGEKFILSWSKNIAKAAKDGWTDQQELDWDSYKRIKEEITAQQLKRAAEMAKAKEMAKIIAVKAAQERAEKAALAKAEKAALAKAEKMARLAEKRKEREEKAKARRRIKKKAGRNSEKNEGELSVAEALKLRQRLTKIHKKKSISDSVAVQRSVVTSQIQAWEKLDLDLVRKEKLQKDISLADQIQAAKNKRVQAMAKEVLGGSSSVSPFSVRSRN